MSVGAGANKGKKALPRMRSDSTIDLTGAGTGGGQGMMGANKSKKALPQTRSDDVVDLTGASTSGGQRRIARPRNVNLSTRADIVKYARPGEDLDWTKVTKTKERKRLQSITAGRKFRERRRDLKEIDIENDEWWPTTDSDDDEGGAVRRFKRIRRTTKPMKDEIADPWPSCWVWFLCAAQDFSLCNTTVAMGKTYAEAG